MNSTLQCQRVLDTVAGELDRAGWETVCEATPGPTDPESLEPEPVPTEWVREGMVPFFRRFLFGPWPAPVSRAPGGSP